MAGQGADSGQHARHASRGPERGVHQPRVTQSHQCWTDLTEGVSKAAGAQEARPWRQQNQQRPRSLAGKPEAYQPQPERKQNQGFGDS